MESPEPEKPLSPILIWLRGVGMGAADIVPGFSGGTVALITGIYPRLVRAISHFDREFLQRILKGDMRGAIEHADLRFLATLVFGIACGLVASLLSIKWMLDTPYTRPYILAGFIGMVLGSAWFVWDSIRAIRTVGLSQWLLIIAGFVIAFAISMLPESAEHRDAPNFLFLFLCGAIAICAMILPGISGALMLMIFGVYEYLLGTLKSLLKLEDFGHDLIVCVVFGLGCATGLMSFSRLLRWLFAKRPQGTLCVMFGLMLGAIIRLWPFMPGKDLPAPEITLPLQLGVAATVVMSIGLTVVFVRLGKSGGQGASSASD